MKDFEMRYVGSHVEVYSGSGAFLFSADTVRENAGQSACSSCKKDFCVWNDYSRLRL